MELGGDERSPRHNSVMRHGALTSLGVQCGDSAYSNILTLNEKLKWVSNIKPNIHSNETQAGHRDHLPQSIQLIDNSFNLNPKPKISDFDQSMTISFNRLYITNDIF